MQKYFLMPIWLLLTTAAVAQQKSVDTLPKPAAGADASGQQRKVIICGPSRTAILHKPDTINTNPNDNRRPIMTCVGTVMSDKPLYIIDGTIYNDFDLENNIDPKDILSINILKGPTAAALYGTRGSNGVIIIDTKSFAYSTLHELLLNYSTKYKSIACQNCMVYIRSGKVVTDGELTTYMRQLQKATIEKVEVVEQPVLKQQYHITDKLYGIITTYNIKTDWRQQ